MRKYAALVLVVALSFIQGAIAVTQAECEACCSEVYPSPPKNSQCVKGCDAETNCAKHKECKESRKWLEQPTCRDSSTVQPTPLGSAEAISDRVVESASEPPAFASTEVVAGAAASSTLVLLIVGGFLWNRNKKKGGEPVEAPVDLEAPAANKAEEPLPPPPASERRQSRRSSKHRKKSHSGSQDHGSAMTPPPHPSEIEQTAASQDSVSPVETDVLGSAPEFTGYMTEAPPEENGSNGGRALSGMFQVSTLQQQLDAQMYAAGGDEGAFFDMTSPDRFNEEMKQFGRSPSIGVRVANKFASFKRSLSTNFKDMSTLPPKPHSPRRRGHTGESVPKHLEESSVKKELRRFYAKHDPSKKSRDIDVLVDWVMSDPKNYNTLRRKLRRKYKETIRKMH